MPFSNETLLVLALYGGLGFTYLFVVPAVLLFYLKERWYDVGSVERFILYMLVFAFFPGMLVLSPFLNFRPHSRNLDNPSTLAQPPYERI